MQLEFFPSRSITLYIAKMFAIRIVARDTVEEKILELQHSKRALADALIGGDGGGLRQLQRADIEMLLS